MTSTVERTGVDMLQSTSIMVPVDLAGQVFNLKKIWCERSVCLYFLGYVLYGFILVISELGPAKLK